MLYYVALSVLLKIPTYVYEYIWIYKLSTKALTVLRQEPSQPPPMNLLFFNPFLNKKLFFLAKQPSSVDVLLGRRLGHLRKHWLPCLRGRRRHLHPRGRKQAITARWGEMSEARVRRRGPSLPNNYSTDTPPTKERSGVFLGAFTAEKNPPEPS